MKSSNALYVPIYAITLLLSAFLLFLVQPMFGKMILPMLGGTPAVWNTAMLFFQVTLLAGYAYAHGTARFMSVKSQSILHIALLILFVFVLPIAIPDGWTPPTDTDPTLWQLTLMAVAVGGPFFVLSGSAPMLQHWFAHTDHKDSDNPYFLYAASNLGSVSALLIYPVLIEPVLKISDQSLTWSFGYGALILLIIGSAMLAWKHAASNTETLQQSKDDEIITWKRRGLWIILAFIPSSLMLGVTTYITTDLASAPLLWIVPLTLYVSTFIIAFAIKPILTIDKTRHFQGLTLIFMLGLTATAEGIPQILIMLIHLVVFFLTALMCHHELSKSKPHAAHLTQFYLLMSLGGALGGFFNAIIAPNLFVVPIEYALILALGCFMRGSLDPEKNLKLSWGKFKEILAKKEKKFLLESGIGYAVVIVISSLILLYFPDISSMRLVFLILSLTILVMTVERRWSFGLNALIILICFPPGHMWAGAAYDQISYRDRNFFGIIRVIDEREHGIRMLLHGTTVHGTQSLAAKYKDMTLSYYYKYSGIANAFAYMDTKPGPQKIATLGLGIGVTACFQKDGRSYDFYEINPQVVEVAENRRLFTYLSDCGSPYEIIMGDARLKLEDKPDNTYDMIIADAFSSDSVPTHLLSLEAFELYKSKLKDDGLLVLNISNRYLNLRNVTASGAHEIGSRAWFKHTGNGTVHGMPYFGSEFVSVTTTPEQNEWMETNEWTEIIPDEDFRKWTDQYSTIITLLKMLDLEEFTLPESEINKVE